MRKAEEEKARQEEEAKKAEEERLAKVIGVAPSLLPAQAQEHIIS